MNDLPTRPNKEFSRIMFPLEKDPDGYPPDNWESLWGEEIEPGKFRIDNIPFFVRGVSPGDLVAVEERGGDVQFREILTRSDISVVRVFVTDDREVFRLRELLKVMGCKSELSHLSRLFSVEIPGDVSLKKVLDLLSSREQEGLLDYEEASIRQHK